MDCHQAPVAGQGACGRPRCAERHFWVLRSDAPWRDLPESFAPNTTRFATWRGLASGRAYSIAVTLTFVPAVIFASFFTSPMAVAKILQGLASRVSSPLEIGVRPKPSAIAGPSGPIRDLPGRHHGTRRARIAAQGQRCDRTRPGALADCGVYAGRDRCRDLVLS